MAENKRSFLLYADQRSIVDLLDDDTAGKLFKFIFSYVNDENPTTDNAMLKLAFEPIRLQLKRDLSKWDAELIKKSDGGILGNLKRWHHDLYKQVIDKQITIHKANEIASNRSKSHTDGKQLDIIASVADNVTDNVTVSVNGNKKYSFASDLLNLGADPKLVEDWIKVRKDKKASNTETAFKLFAAQVQKSGRPINDILTLCIDKSWKGFQAEWVMKSNTLFHSETQKLTAGSKVDGTKGPAYLNDGN